MLSPKGLSAGKAGTVDPEVLGSGRSWLTVWLLCLLYVLSFLDRIALALLIQPIKAELGLSDVQMGVLYGSFFALFYAASSLPIAWLADRKNRKWLIIVGALFWASCTILTGFAHNFTTLAALRFGLAVGEASLTPAAFSLITDRFGPRQRIVAATIFSASGMVGSATGYLIGAGLIAVVTSAVGNGVLPDFAIWRYIMICVGMPVVLVAILLVFVAQEPQRGVRGIDEHAREGLLRHLWHRRRLYGGLFGGAGLGLVCTNAMLAWGPTYLQLTHGFSLAHSAFAFGLAQGFGAVGGTLIVPSFISRLVNHGRYQAASLISPVAGAIGSLLVITSPFASASAYLVLYALGAFLLVGSGNAVLVLLQQIAPANLRATLTSISLIFISCMGLALGPPLVALIAEWVPGAASPLGVGLAGTAVISLFGTGIILLRASEPLARLFEERAAQAGSYAVSASG